jgi:hypothetical protein
MRITGLGPTTIGVLLLATAASYPQLKGNSIAATHKEAAKRAISNCRVLPEGEDVLAGYYYGQLLDPSKRWVEPKTGKTTIEGALLAPVATKSICSLGGSFGEVGASGVAQNVRSIDGAEMRKELTARFKGQVPFTDMATISLRFRPDFKARVQKEKEQPKKTMEIGK